MLEKDGRVVGFVTVDDVIDVMVEEQTEDILRMAAVEPGALDKPYFDNPMSCDALRDLCLVNNGRISIVPIAAHRLGIDPALLSTPLITTLVDATGC